MEDSILILIYILINSAIIHLSEIKNKLFYKKVTFIIDLSISQWFTDELLLKGKLPHCNLPEGVLRRNYEKKKTCSEITVLKGQKIEKRVSGRRQQK